MRRFAALIIAVLISSVMYVPVAALRLDNNGAFYVEDGNTVFGDIVLSGTGEEDYFQSIKENGRNFLMLAPDGSYYFGIFPSGSTLTFQPTSAYYFNVVCSHNVTGIKLIHDGTREITVGSRFMVAANVPMQYRLIVGGSYFVENEMPPISMEMIAEYDGYLIMRDDLSGDGSGGLWGAILDWLASFWDKLRAFFIGLFVPDDGYFQSWFEEVKAAFEVRMGGLSILFADITASFNRLSTSTEHESVLEFTLPKNSLWNGFSGQTVDFMVSARPYASWLRLVLNGIVLIFTVVICYKKLIIIIKT